MSRTFTPCQTAERSIQKKYRRELWGPFVAACKRYELIQSGDRIAVCISGGKDSMLLAKLMQMLRRISDVPFELHFLVMDPGYAPANRQRIQDNAALLGLSLIHISSLLTAAPGQLRQSEQLEKSLGMHGQPAPVRLGQQASGLSA